MGLILDTSVLIAAEKNTIDLARLFDLGSEQNLIIAAITVSELLFGLERARPSRVREHRERFIEWVLDNTAIAAFGLSEARHHARIHAALTAQGRRIGSHDFLIAATALALDVPLLTFNQQEFVRVPGLRVLAVPF